MRLGITPFFVAAMGSAAVAASQSTVDRVFKFEQVGYPYTVYVPAGNAQGPPMPALLLVHGAGGTGPAFAFFWRAFADSVGIILIAPTLPLDAKSEEQVPAMFGGLLDEVERSWRVNPRRVYLFGYSAGGYSVFDAALLASDRFAAAGVFASIISPDYDSIVQRAQRPEGIALYVGDADRFFSLAQVRRTADLLRTHDYTVHEVELPHQDHNYATVADWVNRDAWAFMQAYELPSSR